MAILVCALATWLAWRPMGAFALIFPVTLGHFFLFCNVFRIRPIYELIWTGVYLVNMLYWLLYAELSWVAALTVQTPVTIALILLELRSPHYRGAFYQKVRAQLGRQERPV
ncbi:MAG: hypothetical protein ACE5MM_03005 [Nitrospiraceae bacterium]